MMDYFYGDSEEEVLLKASEYAKTNGVEFEGDENCNDYEGNCEWWGESRRCECGNRRVGWNTHCEDNKWICYAEAW